MTTSERTATTRWRRRALAVPFVVTVAVTAAACGSDAATGTVQVGEPGLVQEPDETVISNPAEPDPTVPTVEEPDVSVVVSNPPPVEVISNPPAPVD